MSNIETFPASIEMKPNPTITVFERSPDGGRGLARDMPVRWALEEVGQPYHVRRLSFEAMKEASHLACQPFGHNMLVPGDPKKREEKQINDCRTEY